MNSLPEPTLIINAVTAYQARTDSYPSFSVKGTTRLKAIVDNLVQQNSWASVIAPKAAQINVINPHLTGSTYDKLRDLCQAYDLWFTINNDTLFIWQRDDPIDNVIPLVSPTSGLTGYPIPAQSGILFQTTFSPLLSQGRKVKLETSVPNLSGEYNLYQVEHVLSSWMEGGPWHSVCQAFKVQ